jgi:hypothetical protein
MNYQESIKRIEQNERKDRIADAIISIIAFLLSIAFMYFY